MTRLPVALTVAALASACTSPTGIVPIGNGMYMSSKLGGMATYSGGAVKAELYQEAAEFCAKQGKQVEPINSTSIDMIAMNYASAEIQLRCGATAPS